MTSTKKVKNNIIIARKNCANYTADGCIGCMMKTEHGTLSLKIDSKLYGKPCVADTKCCYFDSVVLPALP
jgi:hypothetical protein